MKVLLVVEPGMDGVFRHVEQLTYFLLDQPGVTTHLAFSSVRGSPALEDLVETVAAVRGARTLDLRVGNAPEPRDVLAFSRLRRLAREVRPDVIHAHSSKAGALARVLVVTGVRARYFYTPHAYYQMHGGIGLKRQIFRAAERALGRIGTTVHTSDSEANYARSQLGIPEVRQHVLVNGVDGKRFRPAVSSEERRELRAELNLPEAGLILGTVARLSPQKDPLTLYRALMPAMAERPDLHFAHLNAVGELAADTEALISAAPPGVRDRVHLRPAMADPSRFYRALDGFTLPSRYEGLSLAALEAAASGLPLILTDCPGNSDLRPHGFDLVWWSPPENSLALKEQILGWASSVGGTASRVPLVACNHQQVIEKVFSQERQFQGLIRIYRQRGI